MNKLIVVAGCSGSGKTTVAKTILEECKAGQAQIICLDRFYKTDRVSFPKVKTTGKFNFDHPDAFDWELLHKCIKDLMANKTTVLPEYNYVISQREKKGVKTKPTKVIILEGTLPLYDQEIVNLASLKLFVETPLDECLIRRILRDVKSRGRSLDSILSQWQSAVRPMFQQFALPTRSCADLILPWDKVNMDGLSTILPSIRKISK